MMQPEGLSKTLLIIVFIDLSLHLRQSRIDPTLLIFIIAVTADSIINDGLAFLSGIPSTLNYIDMNQTPSGSPPLIPYPSLANNVAGDCANGLSTVYRIKGGFSSEK